jgi:hypothetical protein
MYLILMQWQKPQLVANENCVHENDVVDENRETARDRRSETNGECPICHRSGSLTFHHLIPRYNLRLLQIKSIDCVIGICFLIV